MERMVGSTFRPSRPDRWFRWGLIEFLCTVALFVMALPWGPAGIALAWTISYLILLLPAFWYAGNPIDLRLASVVGAIWKPFFASAVAGASTVVALHFLPAVVGFSGALGAFVKLVGDSLLFFALYIIAIISLYGGMGPISQTFNLVREVMPDRKKENLVPAVEVRGS